MTKKEVCLSHETIGYYSGFTGLEVKYIEYGINDYCYCVSGTWNDKPKYHKLLIRYDWANDTSYVMLHGYKVNFNEIIRMGV